MRLGLQLGYDDPVAAVALAEEADRLGFHLLDVGGVRLGRRHPRWGGSRHARSTSVSAARSCRCRRARRRRPRPRSRRSTSSPAVAPPRSRHVRAAGRGGLARAAGEAARPDTRVRRDRARGAAARGAARAPRALRHPADRRRHDGPRQAVEADPAAAPRRRARLPGGDRAANVALAAEIADGWLPIFFSPERFAEVHLRTSRRGSQLAAVGRRAGISRRSSPSC